VSDVEPKPWTGDVRCAAIYVSRWRDGRYCVTVLKPEPSDPRGAGRQVSRSIVDSAADLETAVEAAAVLVARMAAKVPIPS